MKHINIEDFKAQKNLKLADIVAPTLDANSKANV